MNNTSKVRAMVETATMAIVAVGMIFLSLNPFVSFLGLFCAVPMMVLTARQGVKSGIIGSILLGVFLFMLAGPLTAVTALIMYGFSAVAAGYMLKSQYSATHTIFISALFFAIGTSVLIIGALKFTGVDPFASTNETFKYMSDFTTQNAKVVKMSQADLDEQLKMIDLMKQMFMNIKPGIIIFFGGLLAVSNYFVARLIAHRSGVPIKALTRFREHRMPKSLGSGLLLIILMTYIAGKMNYVDANIIYMNLEFIFYWVFFVQGISVLAYFVHLAPTNKPLRGTIYFMLAIVLIPMHSLEFIALLGLMDTALDIRKLFESRQA